MREIDDHALTLADIPPANADWGSISEFALTYNGFETQGSFEACAEIAHAQRCTSLGEVRTCLYFEQRRWRHYGEQPDDEAMKYIRDLVEQIRRYVTAKQ